MAVDESHVAKMDRITHQISRMAANGLNVEIVDHGGELPEGKLPIGEMASLDVELEDLPEGGFGWFMIHHLTKDVRYDRVNGENHLNLRLAVGTTP